MYSSISTEKSSPKILYGKGLTNTERRRIGKRMPSKEEDTDNRQKRLNLLAL
ncbi:hypothetical protein [Bacillus sp. NSP9.1]|uniref:hypothetical protein n=1 Tax=Bacillus sp. NSP9.1 TaxID=1071078 RepID=UPI000410C1D6|nr:hypothetical protein [Bacillus sp. NSP9.1]QHZ45497.1 hypothetical protein M654_003830 [Bacillus sp. NSP9.1]